MDEKETAAREQVALMDMQRRSEALLQEAGLEASRSLFLWVAAGDTNYPRGVEDNTHFSPKGAACIATEFAMALRNSGLPLARRLKKDAAPPCR